MRREEFPNSRAGRLFKTPRGYWAFVPNPLPPAIDYSPRLVRRLSEADRLLGELAGLGRFLPDLHLLVDPSIRREAVLSSRIEGTQTDLEQLYLFELEPETAPASSDAREVHNYVAALQYGLHRLSELPMSLRLVREIHERLMEGVRGGAARPGEFRTTQNWVGRPLCLLDEATYVPPPVERLSEVLGEWESYIHQADELPPLIRLAAIHYQFEAIHPFADGNGRVGRLLVSLLLCHWDLLPAPLLYLSAFFERHREEYYRCLLRVSQHGEWEEWIEFFLTAVSEQSRDAVSTARSLTRLQARYRSIILGQRGARITPVVLDRLFQRPVITAPLIRRILKVSYNTAQKAIDDLERAGILVEVTGQRRNRTWIAREILDLLSGRSSPGSPSLRPDG